MTQPAHNLLDRFLQEHPPASSFEECSFHLSLRELQLRLLESGADLDEEKILNSLSDKGYQQEEISPGSYEYLFK